ncbi:MAG TPA: hypothetical protein VGO98_00015 [Candidatus Saccharimonadales bacterium]|jgi:hypothetical protein|nr:hypothetical protein [Candidatus Saccharimonadales bacterium]
MLVGLGVEVIKGVRRRQQRKARMDYDAMESYGGQPRYSRRVKALAGFAIVAAAGTGVVMSFTEESGPVTEVSASGGTAEVKRIYRDASEHHVIGFDTEVDGGTAERKLTNRKLVDGVPVLDAIPGVNAIPAPDIVANVRIDDFYVASDLCFPGGRKAMNERVVNGVTHIDYEVDTADIKVCSAEHPLKTPHIAHDGNWVQNMNDASADINRMFPNENGTKNPESVNEEDRIKSLIEKVAKSAMLLTVNRVCAPEVFDITHLDMAKRIAEDIGREGEVVNVTFKPNASGKIAIDGASQIDAFFEERKAEETKDVQWNFDGGIAGTCTIAEDVVDSKDLIRG